MTKEEAQMIIEANPKLNIAIQSLWTRFMHGDPDRFDDKFWKGADPYIVMAQCIEDLKYRRDHDGL
jgi:hypothetical protein